MKDKDITIDLIQPLIVSAEADGNRMVCEFQLPGSDEIVESETYIKRQKTVGSQVKKALKRTAKQQARRLGSQAMRAALGGGIVGRVGRQAFYAGSRGLMSNSNNDGFSKEDEEASIVLAFIKVKDHFHYNEETKTWGRPPAPPPPKQLSPFEQQLKDHPIENTYDRSIFARILAELANADGHLAQEEIDFFNDSIPETVGSIEDLVKGDPVSRIECQEVTRGVNQTIYMCAWIITLIDFDMDPLEQELLMEYGDLFGFTQEVVDELARKAKFYVLENSIDPDTSRAELFELADKINLNRDDAERCKIHMIKRLG
ncbi:MAG: hypothetical protein H6581_16290 [Bacteroidia bacterium]|nr:hypothetical protein [Bacteroidia bacterium]